jgi:hypothetical protein
VVLVPTCFLYCLITVGNSEKAKIPSVSKLFLFFVIVISLIFSSFYSVELFVFADTVP